MELKITKTQNGTHSLPDSIKRNLPLASYEHYESMQVRSIKDIMDRKNDILNPQTNHWIQRERKRSSGVYVCQISKYDKGNDRGEKMDYPEGVKLFIDEVINRYAKKT